MLTSTVYGSTWPSTMVVDVMLWGVLSPQVTPGDPASDAAEEEISLDSVMQHANLDNVALVCRYNWQYNTPTNVEIETHSVACSL